MRKILSLFLGVSLLIPTYRANSQDLYGLNPQECTQEQGCVCYTPAALEAISRGLNDGDTCRKNLELYKGFAKEAQKPIATAWYQDPVFIVGGMVLTFSVSLALGYFVGKK